MPIKLYSLVISDSTSLSRAFGACAASQGCMNNVTFGDDTVGYYETVAGGAGAVTLFRGGGIDR